MTYLTSEPSSKHLDSIKQLLTAHCPRPDLIDAVYEEIVNAIETYRQFAAPLDEGKYRTSASTASNTRHELKEIHKHAAAIDDLLARVCIDTLSALAEAMGQNWGSLKHTVRALRTGVAKAEVKAQNLPDKPSDHHRVLMARDIAAAMQKAGMKVSRTLPGPHITSTRGGAVYGRVLQEACHAAGLSNFSLGPLIPAGIRMLNAPMP